MAAHRRTPTVRFLNGVFRRLCFSRDGHVSGVVLRIDGAPVEVMMGPREGAEILRLVGLGERFPVLATENIGREVAGHGDSAYTLISLATLRGRPKAWPRRVDVDRATAFRRVTRS